MMQDIEIEWEEREVNCSPYNCRLLVTLNRQMKESEAKRLIASGELVNVSFYLDTHDYNGHIYNSIRAFLPKELTEENV